MRRLSTMARAARSAPILLFFAIVAFAHAKLIDMRINLGGEAVDGFAAEEEVLDLDENYSKMRYHGEIKGGADHMNVFRTQRFSRYEDLLINIPVPDGVYTVTLLFAETWKGNFGPGKRVFDVYLGSKPGGIVKVLDQFDAFKSGGPAAAVRRKFEYIATQGGLTIALRPIVQNPQIAGVTVQGYSYSNALIDELPTIPAPTGGNEDFSVLSGIGPRLPSDPSLIYDPALNPKLRKTSAPSSSGGSNFMGGNSMGGNSMGGGSIGGGSTGGGSMSGANMGGGVGHMESDPMSNSGMGASSSSGSSMNSYNPPSASSQHVQPTGHYAARPPSHGGPSTGGPPVPPPAPRGGYGYGAGHASAPSGGASQGYGRGGASSYSTYSGDNSATHGYGTTQYGGYGHHAVYRRRLNSIPEADGFGGMPPPPDMYGNMMGQGQAPPPGAYPPGQDFPPGLPDGMHAQQPLPDAGVVRAFEHNPFAMAPPPQQGPSFPEHPDHGGMPPQDMGASGPAAEFARNQMEAAFAAQQHDLGAAQNQQMPPPGHDGFMPPPGMDMPAPPGSNPFEMAPPAGAGAPQAPSDGAMAGGMPNGAYDRAGVPQSPDMGAPPMDHQHAPQQPPAGLPNMGTPDMVFQQGQPPMDPAMHAQAFQQTPEQPQQPVAEYPQRVEEQPPQAQSPEQQQQVYDPMQSAGHQQVPEQALQAPSQAQQATEQQPQQIPEQPQQAPAQQQQVPEQRLEAPAAQQAVANPAPAEQAGFPQPSMQQLADQISQAAQAVAETAPSSAGTDASAQPAAAQVPAAPSTTDQATSAQTFSAQATVQQAGGASLSVGNSMSLPTTTEHQVKSADTAAQNTLGGAPMIPDQQSAPAPQAASMDSSSVPQAAPVQQAAPMQVMSAQPAQAEAQPAATQPQAAQVPASTADTASQTAFSGAAGQVPQQAASGVTTHQEFQAQSESLQRMHPSQPQAAGEAAAPTQAEPALAAAVAQTNAAPQAPAAEPQAGAVGGTTPQMASMQQAVVAQHPMMTGQAGQVAAGSVMGSMSNYMNARAGTASAPETVIMNSQASASSTQAQAPSAPSTSGDAPAVAAAQVAPGSTGLSAPAAPAAQAPATTEKFVARTVSRTLTNPSGGIVGGTGVAAPQGLAASAGAAQLAAKNSHYNNALRQVMSMMNSLRGTDAAGAVAGTAAAQQLRVGNANAAVPLAQHANAQQVQGLPATGRAPAAQAPQSHDGTVRSPLEVAAAQASQLAGAVAASGNAAAVAMDAATAPQAAIGDSANAGPGIVGQGDLNGLCLHNSTHCSCGMVESPKPEECLFVVNENESPMICMRRPCSGKMVCACAPGANMLCRRTSVKTILVPATAGKVNDFGGADNIVLCKRETLDDGVNVYMPV